MSTAVWAVLGVIGLIVLVVLAIALWAIGAYNNFVRLKNLVSEGWSGIEVQLKRRSNLVPNLVATVKDYAEHAHPSVVARLASRRQLRATWLNH